MHQSRWTEPQRKRFLDVLRKSANVSAAARAVGMSRSSAYQLRRQDPEFRAAWDEALEEALDLLEAELWRRALKGVVRPVFYGGRRCGMIRSYSDQLGMFLLKAHRPERYGALTRGRRELDEEGEEGGTDPRERLLDLLASIHTRLTGEEEGEEPVEGDED
ncbi:MAG: terminase [Alphaproteobacteria bacterium]|nr:MAG: terminase [Alphaproteobacteria bacterium]